MLSVKIFYLNFFSSHTYFLALLNNLFDDVRIRNSINWKSRFLVLICSLIAMHKGIWYFRVLLICKPHWKETTAPWMLCLQNPLLVYLKQSESAFPGWTKSSLISPTIQHFQGSGETLFTQLPKCNNNIQNILGTAGVAVSLFSPCSAIPGNLHMSFVEPTLTQHSLLAEALFMVINSYTHPAVVSWYSLLVWDECIYQ